MPLTPEPAIHYVTDGDTAHPTVVLIAGGGAQLIAWHVDLVAQLVDRGLHVVRLDNRDVGLSARSAGSTTSTAGTASRRWATTSCACSTISGSHGRIWSVTPWAE